MNYQDKLELEKIKAENKKMKKELEEKNMAIKILNKNIKIKEDVIEDLGHLDSKNKCIELEKEIKQYQKVILQKENYITKKDNIITTKDNIISDKNTEIEEIKKKLEIVTQKLMKYEVSNKKDSSNSSKPSSTNGFKKVITNRREKSTKKQGGQTGHKGTSLSPKNIEYIKNNCEYIEENIDINLNKKNRNKQPKIVTTIDIEFFIKIKNLKYYPDKDGKYNIPTKYKNNIQYGENIKAFTADLINNTKCSIDSVKDFIVSLTNQGINLSKGTLVNWSNSLKELLEPVIDDIEEKLLDSHYLNCDESQIKVNGINANLICCSNSKYTRLWYSANKSIEALKVINFLTRFLGVIVKDGTDLYNKFSKKLAQCISHILRYLKGIYDLNSHKKPREMAALLNKMEEERQEAISKGKTEFSKEKLKSLIEEYEKILKEWIKEWQSDEKTNPVYDEERKLLTRFEEKDRKEILYFLTDFKIPFTNNQAEVDVRPVKIKQKIGKFRSEEGAKTYATIRSCINTYKKNKMSVFKCFQQAFLNKPILV